MYKIDFTLRQHTPLIHFQYDQLGATLRATEVKPKLDRFLCEKGIQLDKSLIKHEKAIVKLQKALEEKHSLYSIKIGPSYNVKYYLPLPLKLDSRDNPDRQKNLIEYYKEIKEIDISILAPTPYFANADKIGFHPRTSDVDKVKTDIENIKIGVLESNDINCEINTTDKDIFNVLVDTLSSFFIYVNFGTRQNKGFGSFSVKSINHLKVNSDQRSEILRNCYKYKSIRERDLVSTFSYIQSEYQLLKSGKNHQGYEKSKLFEYFINNSTNPIRWEKRFHKQQINSNKIDNRDLFYKIKNAPIDLSNVSKQEYNEWNDKQVNEYQFVRALLGLAEQFEFLVIKKERDNNGQFVNTMTPNGPKQDSSFRYVVSIEHNAIDQDNKIERFASPLFYKVIDGFVYIRYDEDYPKIFNQSFSFKLKLKGNHTPPVNIGTLMTPKHFDINAFLARYINNKNWTDRL